MLSEEAGFLLDSYSVESENFVANLLRYADNLLIQNYSRLKQDNLLISNYHSRKFKINDKVSKTLGCKYTLQYISKISTYDVNKENMNNEKCKSTDNDRASQTKSGRDEDLLTLHKECVPSQENIKAVKECSKLTCNPYECEVIADILNVIPIKSDVADRQKQLLQKYSIKWKEYVAHKKRQYWYQQKQNTLNTFLNKLKKKKAEINESSESVNKVKLFAKDYGTYQHR